MRRRLAGHRITSFLWSQSTISRNHSDGDGLGMISGEKRPTWGWPYSGFVKWPTRCGIGGRFGAGESTQHTHDTQTAWHQQHTPTELQCDELTAQCFSDPRTSFEQWSKFKMSVGSGQGWQTEEEDEGSGRVKKSCRQDLQKRRSSWGKSQWTHCAYGMKVKKQCQGFGSWVTFCFLSGHAFGHHDHAVPNAARRRRERRLQAPFKHERTSADAATQTSSPADVDSEIESHKDCWSVFDTRTSYERQVPWTSARSCDECASCDWFGTSVRAHDTYASCFVDSTRTNTANTQQYSFFTSEERISRALIKDGPGPELHYIFVRLKRVCHLVRTCLKLCCSVFCRAPRGHLLHHSLFLHYTRTRSTIGSIWSPRRCTSTIPRKQDIMISKMESYKSADFTTVCPEIFGETRCNDNAGKEESAQNSQADRKQSVRSHSSQDHKASKKPDALFFIWVGNSYQEFFVQKG